MNGCLEEMVNYLSSITFNVFFFIRSLSFDGADPQSFVGLKCKVRKHNTCCVVSFSLWLKLYRGNSWKLVEYRFIGHLTRTGILAVFWNMIPRLISIRYIYSLTSFSSILDQCVFFFFFLFCSCKYQRGLRG